MERLANRIILLTGWRRTVIAVLAGASTVFAQAPFHFFAVCFLTFPVLVWLLDGAIAQPSRSRIAAVWPAFVTGWLFGFGYFVGGLWWIGNALFVEAEEFLWMWPVAVFALPAVLALFYGLAAAIARTVWSDGFGRIAALAFGFGLVEWLRTFLFTGFPWNAIGYTMMPVPVLMQAASVIGIIGMNAVAVFAFGLPAAFAQGRLRAGIAAIITISLLAGTTGYGLWRIGKQPAAFNETALVRIVQPAVDQSHKVSGAQNAQIFDRLLDLSSRKEVTGRLPDLIIWPETSIPFILTENPAAVAAIADNLEDGQVLLAGAVSLGEGKSRSGGQAYLNSILALNADGVIFDSAAKVHLVPFGEYLPFAGLLNRMGLKAVAAADRGYTAADRRRVLALPGGHKALPLICYEAIFPGELEAEGETPTVIVNVTNDAWYGDTPGPYQHVHHARIRAVESGMPLIRAANNGVSGIYDGYGRQLSALAYGATGAIEARLPAPLPGTIYHRFGGRINTAILFLFFAAGLIAKLNVTSPLGRRPV